MRSIQGGPCGRDYQGARKGGPDRAGCAGADGDCGRRFSRIRNADLDRFTVDRLMSILNRLGSRIEVNSACGASKSRERPVFAGAPIERFNPSHQKFEKQTRRRVSILVEQPSCLVNQNRRVAP
jgi:hypothetical protein